MSVICPNCGLHNQDGATNCSYCKWPLVEEPVSNTGSLHAGQLMDNGTYRITRPLKRGGMGAIYLAEQPKAFGRLCVIKEVIDYFDPNDRAEREKAMARFEQEAKMLSELRHPGIPDLYMYFSEGGHNYLVMEYIEGNNLSEGLTHDDDDGRTVPGKPYPLDKALQPIIEVCEVLEYLGKREPPIVHNDIKPANIIIDAHSGRAVLVDFGTAKSRRVQIKPIGDMEGVPGRDKSSVYGTQGYAAPERYHGISEPRSDVYSLAATAYHLITDDDPRDHPMQFPKMIEMPHALSQVLSDALNSDVKKRPTASEFKSQLEPLRDPKNLSVAEASLQTNLPAAPPPAVLLLNTREMSFSVKGNKGEGKQSVSVTNLSSSQQRCRLRNVPPWLKVEPTEFTLRPSGATRRIGIEVIPQGKGGSLEAELVVEAIGAPRAAPSPTLKVTLKEVAPRREKRAGKKRGGTLWLAVGAVASAVLVLAMLYVSFGVLPGILNPKSDYDKAREAVLEGNRDLALQLIRATYPNLSYLEADINIVPMLDEDMVPVGYDGQTRVDLYPVTNVQFYARNRNSAFEYRPGEALNYRVMVTFSEAKSYCTSVGKRLPNAEEWERAYGVIYVPPGNWEWAAPTEGNNPMIVTHNDHRLIADQRYEYIGFRCIQ